MANKSTDLIEFSTFEQGKIVPVLNQILETTDGQVFCKSQMLMTTHSVGNVPDIHDVWVSCSNLSDYRLVPGVSYSFDS